MRYLLLIAAFILLPLSSVHATTIFNSVSPNPLIIGQETTTVLAENGEDFGTCTLTEEGHEGYLAPGGFSWWLYNATTNESTALASGPTPSPGTNGYSLGTAVEGAQYYIKWAYWDDVLLVQPTSDIASCSSGSFGPFVPTTTPTATTTPIETMNYRDTLFIWGVALFLLAYPVWGRIFGKL